MDTTSENVNLVQFLFLYNKIREERVDTIKKPYPTYLNLLGSGFSVSED